MLNLSEQQSIIFAKLLNLYTSLNLSINEQRQLLYWEALVESLFRLALCKIPVPNVFIEDQFSAFKLEQFFRLFDIQQNSNHSRYIDSK